MRSGISQVPMYLYVAVQRISPCRGRQRNACNPSSLKTQEPEDDLYAPLLIILFRRMRRREPPIFPWSQLWEVVTCTWIATSKLGLVHFIIRVPSQADSNWNIWSNFAIKKISVCLTNWFTCIGGIGSCASTTYLRHGLIHAVRQGRLWPYHHRPSSRGMSAMQLPSMNLTIGMMWVALHLKLHISLPFDSDDRAFSTMSLPRARPGSIFYKYLMQLARMWWRLRFL